MRTETTVHHGEPWKLNLDVLLLIATLANPCDLLVFACTCKRFRELLKDKSSDLIWKTARSKFRDIPDCPADLTEWEYTDLAFRPRCHDCGQFASPAFWEVRRRYCLDCRDKRLCHISSCPEIVQHKYVLGIEQLSIVQGTPFWVDKKQMELFMEAYEYSSDKKQILIDRQERLVSIRNHAHRCQVWQRDIEAPLLRKRVKSIFERLKQLGYGPEIKYSGNWIIRDSQTSLFNTSKPLTDKEWDRTWPQWAETMNNFRLQRLENTIFEKRRRSLVPEYDAYVKRSSKDTPSFELLPHVADVARFTPFRDIIRAPEGTYEQDELFGSAFAQLPRLVDEWRKKLDAELADLVQIPSQSSFDDSGGGKPTVSTSDTCPKSFKTPEDKLRLACALFSGVEREGLFNHPEVFFISMCHHKYPKENEDDSERTGSIWDRFRIKWVKEAPRVVYACGLDPNVATAEDMDRRDARLECLPCGRSSFYDWREATWHAHNEHQKSNQTRWRRVDDADSDMAQIRAAERARTHWHEREQSQPYTLRCLLCIPHVGSAKKYRDVLSHVASHDRRISELSSREGVHYASVAKVDHRWVNKVKKPREEGFEFKWYQKRLHSLYSPFF